MNEFFINPKKEKRYVKCQALHTFSAMNSLKEDVLNTIKLSLCYLHKYKEKRCTKCQALHTFSAMNSLIKMWHSGLTKHCAQFH